MSEVVVDTNVWVMPEARDTEPSRVECAEVCRQWLSELRTSNRSLVVDEQWAIMREYRDNIPKSGFADRLLRELQKQAGRIIWVAIQFESDGQTAILPSALGLQNFDPSDRKFVAVALARDPHSPIYNAADPDWRQHTRLILAAGLTVVELCPNALKYNERSL